MAIDKKSLKKIFPHLAKELEEEDAKIGIDSIQEEAYASERAPPDKLRNYEPTIIDFIRRCNTRTQAESIIGFMERRGEIGADYAKQLRQQLRKEGLRSFGPKKDDNYYFKAGGLC